MEQAAGKTEASVEADLNFHLAILEATHNSFMRPFGALVQAAVSKFSADECGHGGVSPLTHKASCGPCINNKWQA